jgi:hypothetical protein
MRLPESRMWEFRCKCRFHGYYLGFDVCVEQNTPFSFMSIFFDMIFSTLGIRLVLGSQRRGILLALRNAVSHMTLFLKKRKGLLDGMTFCT